MTNDFLLMFPKSLLTYFLLLLMLVSACEKIELPQADNDGNVDDEMPMPPDNDEEILTVLQALAADEGDYVAVRGYIIGFVNGTSLSEKNVVLGLPTEKPNTNMLIADNPEETDLAKMMPVGLPENYSGMQVREDLNLYDNPSFFHRQILVEGFITAYFRRMGFKRPSVYWLLEEEDAPDENTHPDDSLPTPGFSHDEALIEGGR